MDLFCKFSFVFAKFWKNLVRFATILKSYKLNGLVSELILGCFGLIQFVSFFSRQGLD
jgi:hypothetical protein